MFPRIGGVPRLVETRALSVYIAVRETPYDFFVADDRCIVSITGFGGATTNSGIDWLLINDETDYVNSFAQYNNTGGFSVRSTVNAQGRLIAGTHNAVGNILLLLEKGERIRITNTTQSAAHTVTATAYVYK